MGTSQEKYFNDQFVLESDPNLTSKLINRPIIAGL